MVLDGACACSAKSVRADANTGAKRDKDPQRPPSRKRPGPPHTVLW